MKLIINYINNNFYIFKNHHRDLASSTEASSQ